VYRERFKPSLREPVDAVGFDSHGKRAIANTLTDFARGIFLDLANRAASQRQDNREQREPLAPHCAPSSRASSLRMS
jgi:hypothetical protein